MWSIKNGKADKFLQKDPLEELWELYEGVQEKPSLAPENPSALGSPNEANIDHPVINKRKQVDMARVTGMEPGEAHESIHGEVDLASPDSKGELAATF